MIKQKVNKNSLTVEVKYPRMKEKKRDKHKKHKQSESVDSYYDELNNIKEEREREKKNKILQDDKRLPLSTIWNWNRIEKKELMVSKDFASFQSDKDYWIYEELTTDDYKTFAFTWERSSVSIELKRKKQQQNGSF